MRTRIIIAVISLAIGLFAGAKIMEHLGREYIVNNFPIPSGTLDDKDAYIKKIEIGLEVPEKKLKKVEDLQYLNRSTAAIPTNIRMKTTL